MIFSFCLRHPRTGQEKRQNQERNGGWHRPSRRGKRLPDSWDDVAVHWRIYRNWKKQYKVGPMNGARKHRRTHQHHVKCMGCGVTIRRSIMSKYTRRGTHVVARHQPQHCL
jgi:hypothetical protein